MYNIPETGWVVELLVTLLQWDPQHCIGTYNMYLSLQQNSKGNYRIFKNLIDFKNYSQEIFFLSINVQVPENMKFCYDACNQVKKWNNKITDTEGAKGVRLLLFI